MPTRGADALIGKRLGEYEILEQVGCGAMAAVYKAFSISAQRVVALKILRPYLTSDEEFVLRFRREATVAARLTHPNVVWVYEVGAHDGLYFIVMDYVKGITLKAEIEKGGPLPLQRVTAITNQLADALDYAHQEGVIHRDVKSSNIMLGNDDHVTLTDFGVAKSVGGTSLTQLGTMVGTLEYMSPEQAMGEEIDGRSDLYSVGTVVYEMLTGRVPFRDRSPHLTLQRLIYEAPPPLTRFNPAVPEGIEHVVLKALAKRPERRYPTVRALARALKKAARAEPADVTRAALSPAHPPSEAPTHPAPMRGPVPILVCEDGARFAVRPGVMFLGRLEDNDVIIADDRVSRYHAELHFEANVCVIMDLGSTNGTFVNGRCIAPHMPCVLHPGDEIQLGRDTPRLVLCLN